MLDRRQILFAAAWPALATTHAQAQSQAKTHEPIHADRAGMQRLAAAWRTPNATGTEPVDHVGILTLDWAARRVRVAADLVVPSRAHGVTRLPDGGFVAMAARPGRWIMRFDSQGQLVQTRGLDGELPARTLGGHAEPSPDGRWLYTTETDTRDGSGWVSVRDLSTLERVASLPTQGLDPHDLTLDADGLLWVANGGIPRDAAGRKQALHRMAPSLVQIDPANARILSQQTLTDPRLSLRHLAWEHPGDTRVDVGTPGNARLLGIGLQAEHEQGSERREAPLLAVSDGKRLRIPSLDAQGEGYCGDISAAPGGGFALSGQKVGRGLWWHPGAGHRLQRFAELGEPCALSDFDDGQGVLLGAARGVARWHIHDAPAMLPWPQTMNLDNHWVLLG